jgi:hypothetical protein
MTNSSRPPVTGSDVIGAGFLMLSVDLMCAGVGALIGIPFGAVTALAIIGFLIGFLVGIRVVISRFRDI